MRGADDAVAQGQLVQRERLEKIRVTHRDRPRVELPGACYVPVLKAFYRLLPNEG
jgi:hypothetical protein